VKHWHNLWMLIWHMMWGAKFDNKVPDLAKTYKILPRTNVLGLIEKLQRATSDNVQHDYQWLCNCGASQRRVNLRNCDGPRFLTAIKYCEYGVIHSG